MDKEKIIKVILDNKRVMFELLLVGVLSYFMYDAFTKPYPEIDTKPIIEKIEKKRAEDYAILQNIQHALDSIHVEQRYVIEQIDGTQKTIKNLEKQRYVKIVNYTSNPDSTISFLSDRYNSVKLSKDSLSRRSN